MWAGLGVHDRTEWVFMMDQNWCSPSAEYAERQSLIEPVEMVPGVSNISHFLGTVNLKSEIHELYESQLSSST